MWIYTYNSYMYLYGYVDMWDYMGISGYDISTKSQYDCILVLMNI